ncbi:cyclic nucleotide-binding domain-containing protein [Desulforhopalus sp. IMCC35007]|uniref:cyclic nucleotide-binding domain-containing protein n=1 Tax=Desulforhopalus sp. IMCC35007 TaxID=2569543 RepID=UPI0010AE7E90|nr:cyclic nucleotide-binding domain-containing protein [Desulforhopalus sp. IMCC35007]TKB07038.1 cyclic nucleotide-binding domain-containing protein [Desulforhopalus sp. IMCC35007]
MATISSTIRQNIRQIELFNGLSDDEIDILVKHAKIHSLVEDEVLFNEGDDGDFFAIVIDGQIEVRKLNEYDQPVAIAALTSGATLGEMSLIDHEARSASAIATAPSTLFILSRKSFDTLVEQSPRCGVKLIRKIATILCATIRRTSNLFADAIEQR